MDTLTEEPSGITWGCMWFPAFFLVVGIAAIAAGFLWPDVTTFNSSTGRHDPLSETGPVVGGVFTGIGIIGLGLWAYIEIASARSSSDD